MGISEHKMILLHKRTLPVRYKHVLTGGNRALLVEYVYQSGNSRAVNDRAYF